MFSSHLPEGNFSLTTATAAAVTIGAAVIGGMIIMGILMMGHMGGASSAQDPVISAESEMTVDIRDFDYLPRDLTVNTGTRVTWINQDGAPHTATVKDDWDTGTLNLNEAGSLTFDTPGTFEYICTIHPHMKATLTIR